MVPLLPLLRGTRAWCGSKTRQRLTCTGVALMLSAGCCLPSMAEEATAAAAVRDMAAASSPDDGIANLGTVRTVVRAYEAATLGAEINARIAALPKREGERFKSGDVLVEFDCSRLVAERDAVASQLKSYRLTLASQRKLLRYIKTRRLGIQLFYLGYFFHCLNPGQSVF